jgi:hypothetical protein
VNVVICVITFLILSRNPHHFKEYKHKHLAALLASTAPHAKSSPEQTESLTEQLKIYADIEKLLNRQEKVEAGKKLENNDKTSLKNLPHEEGEKSSAESKTKRERSASPGETAAKKMAPARGKSRIEARLEAAAPYNFLLTKIKDDPQTHNDNHR